MRNGFALVAALATLAVAPSAQAAPGDQLTCEFTGLAGNIFDDGNGSNGIPSWQRDLQDGQLQDVEHGTYQYGGLATCSGRMNGSIIASALNNSSISSNGEYFNYACGNGWATDPNGANTTISTPGGTISNNGYEILFGDGNGVMWLAHGGESFNPHHSGQITGNWRGHGAARITPVSPDNCVTTDTNEFSVAGHFTIADGAPSVDPGPLVQQVLDLLPDQILPTGTREASKDCDTTPNIDVIDLPLAGGRVRLRGKQSGTSLWVCVRLEAPGGTHVGGKLILTQPGTGGGGMPTVDSSSQLCGTTLGNQAPGPHPILGPGTVAGQQVLLDTWSGSNGQTWICAEVGTTKARVVIATPGVNPGGVSFEPDA